MQILLRELAVKTLLPSCQGNVNLDVHSFAVIQLLRWEAPQSTQSVWREVTLIRDSSYIMIVFISNPTFDSLPYFLHKVMQVLENGFNP